jgi:hypothetical protein
MVSRRIFLRNVAAGAAATAGLNLLSIDGNVARAQETADHLSIYLSHILKFDASPETTAEFQALAKDVIDVVNADPNCRATFDAVIAWLSSDLVTIPEGQPNTILGVPVDLSNVYASAYLRSLAAVETAKEAPTFDSIKGFVSNPLNIFSKIEPDFPNQLSDQLKVLMASDLEFARRMDKATNELAVIGPEIPEPEAQSKDPGSIRVPRWLAIAVAVVIIVVSVIVFTDDED